MFLFFCLFFFFFFFLQQRTILHTWLQICVRKGRNLKHRLSKFKGYFKYHCTNIRRVCTHFNALNACWVQKWYWKFEFWKKKKKQKKQKKCSIFFGLSSALDIRGERSNEFRPYLFKCNSAIVYNLQKLLLDLQLLRHLGQLACGVWYNNVITSWAANDCLWHYLFILKHTEFFRMYQSYLIVILAFRYLLMYYVLEVTFTIHCFLIIYFESVSYNGGGGTQSLTLTYMNYIRTDQNYIRTDQ